MKQLNASASKIGAAVSIVLLVALILGLAAFGPRIDAALPNGRAIFRFETFGDEQLWTDVLRMHEVIPDVVDPLTALDVGLKLDVEALPPEVLDAIANGVGLDDPAVTVELIRLDSVVGVVGNVEDGVLTSVGVTCALCHSTVDDSFGTGVGHRLDGWPNRDLDPGRILSLSPFFDEGTKDLLDDWGPGKYDPRHHAFDGTNVLFLNDPPIPVLIPPAYGLKNVIWETYTGDGLISYWNSYVAVSQMGGQGNFADDRLEPEIEIEQEPDLVTPLLPALLAYQLSLKAPKPPKGSFNHPAADRGSEVFAAACASCHPAPTYTDVANGPNPDQPLLHDTDEVDADSAYADRSATGQYRATPLRALWQHPPYFHDGSAADLEAVVDHYVEALPLDLTPQEKEDLVEFLKSL
ncbi:MAG TPA: c-type cytochrome [Thermoanaerobaculia bacterium]|nr:c-type cytochrome [Thermoanaerobaculia bacterium]